MDKLKKYATAKTFTWVIFGIGLCLFIAGICIIAKKNKN